MNNDNLGNSVIRGLFWKFMERISAQSVTFVVSIILARLLLPSDYGAITLVMVFISLANVFVTGGFGVALVQKKDADNVDFSSVFYFNITFSVVLYIALWFAAPLISVFYNMPILTPVLRVLSIKLILAGINSVQQAYVQRNMLFYRFFWSTLIGTVGSAVVGIGMALAGFGVWALVAQYLFNSTLDTLVLWITVKWRPIKIFNIKRLKKLIGFGWKILADNLVITLYDNLKSLIIGKKYSSSDLAYYSKGVNFPSLIVTNVNSAIGSVLFPALSMLQDDFIAIKRGLKRSIKVSSFVMMPLMVGLFVVSPNVILILLTEKWNQCVPFLKIACFYYAFFPITTANLQALNAIGRSDITLKLTLIKRVSGIVLILCTINQGVMAIAFTDVFVTLLAVVLNTYYNGKFFEYSLVEQIKDLLPSVFNSFIMGGGVYILGKVLEGYCSSILVVLTLQVLCGVNIYILLAYIFDKENFRYILNKIKKKS